MAILWRLVAIGLLAPFVLFLPFWPVVIPFGLYLVISLARRIWRPNAAQPGVE